MSLVFIVQLEIDKAHCGRWSILLGNCGKLRNFLERLTYILSFFQAHRPTSQVSSIRETSISLLNGVSFTEGAKNPSVSRIFRAMVVKTSSLFFSLRHGRIGDIQSAWSSDKIRRLIESRYCVSSKPFVVRFSDSLTYQ